MKKGLVLEGGAMRGMFTAGVIDVMMANGIQYDGAIGVSAGACFGCNYKSGQIGRVIRYNMAYAHEPRYCSFASWLFTGNLYNAGFCYGTVPEKRDLVDIKTFEENPMEFWVTTTDVHTGEPVYKKLEKMDHDTLEWIRASASMPIAAKTVKIDGYEMLDGGISDSIPVRKFEEFGYDRLVLVLTQPAEYRKTDSKAMDVMALALRKYPAIVDAMRTRAVRYNETLEYIREKEEAGEIFVIRPDEALKIGKVEHDPAKMLEVYDQGRDVTKRRLEELKKYLRE